MNFPTDFNSVPLLTADTLMFWGFIIGSGILVAQLSTKLSDRLSQKEVDESENVAEVAEVDEASEAEQQVGQKSENSEATTQTEVVGEEGVGEDELKDG